MIPRLVSIVVGGALFGATAIAAPVTQTGSGYVGPMPGVGEPEPVANPLADDATARMDGRRYFVQFNCSGCHGGHAGGGMGPSLRDPAWIYGGDGGDIYDSIAQGRAHGMPAWGKLLPADVIWRITAYVQSLRTSEEPEPPQ